MGKRCTEIARRLNGRSDNAVKNWWNGSMNRRRRLVLRRRTSSEQCSNPLDERAQPLFFAHPATARRTLTITSHNDFSSAARRGPNESLLSPAVSEDPRAESVDVAPSLVSDCESAFSVSPRLETSPSIELPPPSILGRDARRPNISMVRPNTFFSEAAFSMRYHAHSKVHGLASISSPYPHSRQQQQQRQEPHVHAHVAAAPLPPSPQDHYYGCRAQQVLTAPPTPLQLPPLQMRLAQHERPEPPASERDSRMHRRYLPDE